MSLWIPEMFKFKAFITFFLTFCSLNATEIGIISNSTNSVIVDKNSKILYKFFLYDNGNDYEHDGLVRIVNENGLIGYFEPSTHKIVIKPKFRCAYPFENGIAKVAIKCSEITHGEYKKWQSDEWVYINKNGKKVK
ncbi:hypothetical protein KDD93_08175 [Campylobacter sp. faydin G-24]|uniref:WG repeat-containing protein n=1 Tax=Campylobacter anatolicus TaxID=2829105 RepID=A0ABS5HJV8_9BACT|nr:hypothetical protein [Campylobacter anatolicus]MBR8464538.1 hypothetical protein [Campylobacter anatolicus]